MMITPVANSMAGGTTLPPEVAAQRRALVTAANEINANGTLGSNRELTFVVDPATQHVITRVIDTQTKEVVMQLPSEYVLRLAADLRNATDRICARRPA